jgi:hypothetical protein
VVVALADTVTEWALGALPHDGSDPDVVAALRNKHPGALLALYHNWCNRLISVHPRKVMRSEPFNRRLVSAEQPDVIGKIIADIEQGVDLTRYLSRRVRVGFELPKNSTKKKLRQRQHLDLLLNEWKIHHLHLDATVEAHGFVKRGAPLLFAMFLPGKAYLLDIGTHDSFADECLAHIAIETWPDEQLFLEIKGILGPRGGNAYSADDRRQLRGVGLASFIQIGDRVFMPPGGITSAGTSTQATLWSNHVMRTLKKFEEQVRENPSRIIAFIREHGGDIHEAPEFKFAIFANGFGVIETQSGVPVNLSG